MTIENSEISSLEIKYYKVSTRYTSNYSNRRLIFLSSVDSKVKDPDIAVESVFIYFFLPEHEMIKDNAHVIGHIRSSEKMLELSLPISEFEDMYKILQTEKPVYFYWATEKDKPWLTIFGISSTESEFPGEGFKDSSWFGEFTYPTSEELVSANLTEQN